MEHLNNFHGNLKFTFELENENKINFSNMIMMMEFNKILTKILGKIIYCEIILDYYCIHNIEQKRVIAPNSIDRALKLISASGRIILEEITSPLISRNQSIKLMKRMTNQRTHTFLTHQMIITHRRNLPHIQCFYDETKRLI